MGSPSISVLGTPVSHLKKPIGQTILIFTLIHTTFQVSHMALFNAATWTMPLWDPPLPL